MEDIIPQNYDSHMPSTATHYAFTYNPAQQWEDRADRIQKILSSTKRHLDKYSFIYHLKWELSNPDKCQTTSRLHFHGYIYWPNHQHLVRWYQEQRNELAKHGMFVIKDIDDPQTWSNYIHKDQDTIKIFSKILHVDPYIESFNYVPPKPTKKALSKSNQTNV